MLERNNEKETKPNPIIKIGTVFALSAAALTGCATANAEGPVSTPSATSSEVTPSPTETSPANEGIQFKDPESFAFPATASPEDLANLYVKFSTEQETGYLAPGYKDARIQAGGGVSNEEFANTTATTHLTNLYNALAIPNWQSIPGLQQSYNINYKSDAAQFLNYGVNSGGTLSLNFSLDNYSVITQTESTIIEQIDMTESYQTTWPKDTDNAKTLNGYKSSEIVTFQKSGDKWLFADWKSNKQ